MGVIGHFWWVAVLVAQRCFKQRLVKETLKLSRLSSSVSTMTSTENAKFEECLGQKPELVCGR